MAVASQNCLLQHAVAGLGAGRAVSQGCGGGDGEVCVGGRQRQVVAGVRDDWVRVAGLLTLSRARTTLSIAVTTLSIAVMASSAVHTTDTSMGPSRGMGMAAARETTWPGAKVRTRSWLPSNRAPRQRPSLQIAC